MCESRACDGGGWGGGGSGVTRGQSWICENRNEPIELDLQRAFWGEEGEGNH